MNATGQGETLFSIAAIRAAARSDYKWWGRDEMRFFGTRASGPVIPVSDGSLFITSEKPSWGPRSYSVRFAYRDQPRRGEIETVGDGFGAYASLSIARRAQREIAAAWQGIDAH